MLEVLASKRTIRDRVHAQIELDPFLVAIIDTPHYQVGSLRQ